VERGIAMLGARRAGLAGRAPCIYDIEIAAALFGYLADAPSDLVTFRKPLFAGLGHSYDAQRSLADVVPDDVLGVNRADQLDVAAWRDRLCT